MKRPLLAVVLLYACGILGAEFVLIPLLPLLCVTLLFVTSAILLPRFRLPLLGFVLVLAGLANSLVHNSMISPIDLRRVLGIEPHLACVRGTLLETPTLRVLDEAQQSSWRTLARVKVCEVRLDKGSWQPAAGNLAVTTPGSLSNLFCGQSVEITGVAAQPKTAVAEGTFDYRQYLKRQGIYYQLQAESENDWQVIGTSPGLPLADRFGRWARGALARGLPSEDESLRLEWALALGWKTALTEERSEPFVRAATYHIFAVDGLRMAIIFGIFYGLLRAVALPRPLCGMILIPIIWFYVALTGWPASAIRATVMLTIIIFGWVLKRPGNPINSLFAAALIILCWEPQQLFQAGFQLSFLVVLCLILILPPVLDLVKKQTAPDPLLPRQLQRHWHPFLQVPGRYLTDVLATSFAAWVGSIPLVAYYFNILTPISTPANVLAVPVCVLVLISNLLSLLFAWWLPSVSVLFNHAGWFCMEIIRVTSEWFTHWPAAYYYVPAPSLFAILLYYVLLLAVVTGWLFRPAPRAFKLSVLSVAILLWGWTFCRQLPVTRLFVLPVHGGTAVYCDAFGLKNDLLIDIGSTNSVQFITKPFLRAQGVNRAPPLVLTHGDIHHVGGVEPFRQAFDLDRIFTSPLRYRSVPYRRILTRFASVKGLVSSIARDDLVAGWTILHPDSTDRFPRADDGALVLRADLRGTRVLLLSDLGSAGQKTLLERSPDLRADIVVAGLPAADEPLSDALLKVIDPQLIIISDSEFPVSERASSKLRARLQRAKCAVLYTRATGSVAFEFDHRKWTMRTMNGLKLDSRQPDFVEAISNLTAEAR